MSFAIILGAIHTDLYKIGMEKTNNLIGHVYELWSQAAQI